MSTQICVASTRAQAEQVAQAFLALGGVTVAGIGPSADAQVVEANGNVRWQSESETWIVIVTDDEVHNP